MSWSIGFDHNWNRDIGYGIPAICDHPGCNEEIDRGLSYVCGGEPYGGDRGCGLYFCSKHRYVHTFKDGDCCELCKRCHTYKPNYKPKQDHPEWIHWKLTDDSWAVWRKKHPKKVEEMKKALSNK